MQTLKKDTQLPPYIMFPRFLLNSPLKQTSLSVYLLLLDRARLSMTKNEWVDNDGDVFLIYTQHQLAEALNRSVKSVYSALRELERHDYIARKQDKSGCAPRIYVKIPSTVEESVSPGSNLPQGAEEVYESPLQFSSTSSGRKFPPSKNYIERTIKSNDELSGGRRVYGQFANIYLSQAEYTRLSAAYPNLDRMIENMSRYLASSGKQYANYEAALRSWAARNPESYANISYECEEGESL